MKHFHKGLYQEGLKQLRLIGLIFTGIMAIWALLVPLSNVVNAANISTKTIYSGIGFNPLFLLVFCAFVPLMTLNLFSFLNKRSKSDFYHSLPHRRETIFCSFTLSIITWMFIAVLLSVFVTAVIALFASKYIVINFISTLYYILGCLAGGLLVLGATSLAMSITGTTVSNVVTALLIIFLPRAIIMLFTRAVQIMLILVPQSNPRDFSLLPNNIPVNFIFSLLSFSIDNVFSGYIGALYTAGIGVIFLLLARILFIHRKSECASKPAINDLVQIIIQVAVSMAICTIACFLLLTTEDWSSVIITFVLALSVYFIYELVTKKRIADWKKTMLGLVALLIINIAFIGGSKLVTRSILNKDLTKENITGFSFISASNSTMYQVAYEDVMSEKIIFDDPALIEKISEILQQNQDLAKKGEREFWKSNWKSIDNLRIKLKKGGDIERNLYLSEKDLNAFMHQVQNAKDGESFFSLPQDTENIQIFSPYELSTEEIKEIYQSLVEECKTLKYNPVQNANSFLVQKSSESEKVGLGEIEVIGLIDDKEFYSYYMISFKTPKTLELFASKLNQNNAKYFEDYINLLKNSSSEERQMLIQDASFYEIGDNKDAIYFYLNELPEETLDSALETLEKEFFKQEKEGFNIENPIYALSFVLYHEESGEWRNYHYVFDIQENDALKKILTFERSTIYTH